MNYKIPKPGFFFVAIVFGGMIGYTAFGQGDGAPRRGQAAHESIASYGGPATCLACHQNEATDMFGSVHYQWTGPSPNVTNFKSDSGKADVGFNTYCGSVLTSRRAACWSCHAGNGRVPRPVLIDEQLANIDCLTCHQDAYRRKASPPIAQLPFRGYDGFTRTWSLPEEDADGNFQYLPDEAAMGMPALTAARTVHLPARTTCLSCHAHAAGSDCGKRGDLTSEMTNPPLWAEIHMSPHGANLACTNCHDAGRHRLKGRGLDITTNEGPERLTCLSGGCHPPAPHQDARLDGHTGRVACQTCHIPTFAKLRSTETRRFWLNPSWSQGLFGGQGGFTPEKLREMMVVPSYLWFDGTSVNYVLSQATPPPVNAQGAYEFGLPNGGVDSEDALIYPMKEHTSDVARHVQSGRFIPHSMFLYFVTGDFAGAVAEGQAQIGLPGPWNLVEVNSYRTINHGVEPADKALTCDACHPALAGGRPVRLDLKGKLGYETRAGFDCTQCHGPEEAQPFVGLHDRHVRTGGVACVRCHNFSRPPRA